MELNFEFLLKIQGQMQVQRRVERQNLSKRISCRTAYKNSYSLSKLVNFYKVGQQKLPVENPLKASFTLNIFLVQENLYQENLYNFCI